MMWEKEIVPQGLEDSTVSRWSSIFSNTQPGSPHTRGNFTWHPKTAPQLVHRHAHMHELRRGKAWTVYLAAELCCLVLLSKLCKRRSCCRYLWCTSYAVIQSKHHFRGDIVPRINVNMALAWIFFPMGLYFIQASTLSYATCGYTDFSQQLYFNASLLRVIIKESRIESATYKTLDTSSFDT